MPWIANMSEEAAVKFDATLDDVCISITAPGRPEPPPRLSRFGAVLRVAFHDFDPITNKVNAGYVPVRLLGAQPSDYKLVAMNEQHAELIAGFARLMRGRNLLVHCAAGVSRSGAVVEALLQAFPEYEDLGWQRMPNAHILTLMKRALGLGASASALAFAAPLVDLPPDSPTVTSEDVKGALDEDD